MTADILEYFDEFDATVMTVDGKRTREEVGAGIMELIERFKTSPTRNVAIDIRDAVYDQPIDDVVAEWALVAAALPPARVALVASARTLPQAVAAVKALSDSHHEARVFDQLTDAFLWLSDVAAS
jgi:hypothetical protein